MGKSLRIASAGARPLGEGPKNLGDETVTDAPGCEPQLAHGGCPCARDRALREI